MQLVDKHCMEGHMAEARSMTSRDDNTMPEPQNSMASRREIGCSERLLGLLDLDKHDCSPERYSLLHVSLWPYGSPSLLDYII